jgi:hypothetical protein
MQNWARMHARKRELALQTCKLTLNMMAWSATTIADGDEPDFTITGEVLQKGIFEFVMP